MTEDEVVGWHHRLTGHEFEQTMGDCEGQGGLVCCSPWGLQRVGHDMGTKKQQIIVNTETSKKEQIFSAICRVCQKVPEDSFKQGSSMSD